MHGGGLMLSGYDEARAAMRGEIRDHGVGPSLIGTAQPIRAA